MHGNVKPITPSVVEAFSTLIQPIETALMIRASSLYHYVVFKIELLDDPLTSLD
jgi:hypothetical protein